MDKLLSFLQEVFKSCDDIIFKSFPIKNRKSYLIYSSILVNKQAVSEVERELTALLISDAKWNYNSVNIQCCPLCNQKMEVNYTKGIVEQILSGQAVLLVEGMDDVFSFRTQCSAGRAIEEPETESVIRGSREGFVESIDTNVMLIRRKIKTSSLKIQYLTLGEQIQTKAAIVYLKDAADETVVKEVHKRMSSIEMEGILESRYIESMIQDAPLSPFPTIFNTERPDRLCAGLLEGKVAVLTDGTPFALTMPAVFIEFLHSNEDYYNGAFPSSIVRWIRGLGLLVALILPAFLVAILTIHQELLQPPFLIHISGYREDLPYPVLVECIFALLTFELLREAGRKMPRLFHGPVITLLGILIIGQIAVRSGLIAPLTVVVIAVANLTAFILPNYDFQQVIRYLCLPMLLLAGFFGFMGILIGMMILLTHVINLRSFGTPYLSPISPYRKGSWRDVFLRAPWWGMKLRDSGVGVSNVRRSRNNNFSKTKMQCTRERQNENE